MIDFRYHLVSVIAVFLALTVGIALGGALLRPLTAARGAGDPEPSNEAERPRSGEDLAERLSTGGDRLADAYAGAILHDRLAGVGVAVVEAPGTDRKLREGVVERIEQAGGSVPGRLTLADTYVEAGEAVFVRELTEQLAADAGLPQGSTYDRAGALLGDALLRSGGEPAEGGSGSDAGSDFDAAAALAGFAEGGLLSVHGEPAGAADLTVVLAPDGPFAGGSGAASASASAGDGSGGSAADRAMLDTAAALHRFGEAAVLVGGPDSAGPGGLVRLARAEEAAYTTVDAAGRSAGDVAAVLAVAAAAEGRTGAYGVAEGAEAFLPAPLPGARRADGEKDGSDGAGGAEDAGGDEASEGGDGGSPESAIDPHRRPGRS
ncbi:copper transporter [Streptomonospora wellingtoniae]|uniref:Copper transporter n=1 Tax=Streptomonospora wellingtoniae TaxID=3075544 RepID=A0ABU2KVQ1_9ACTN|nr:copper transporter [Streptomonospora sp. DSM 45055]MDT0303128.1 copper transporter [Streptomonospora sp. DSM 45055]